MQLLAPAKINFCLHVGGKRTRDGLHDLKSLVMFADIGDTLSVSSARELDLTITGPFASSLATFNRDDNLVLRAARLLKVKAGAKKGAHITLEKNLPVASGIGGGTADAAATMILLRKLWAVDISDAELSSLAFDLGADGPICLYPHIEKPGMAVMSGAGEQVSEGPGLPELWVCLANPGVAVSTAETFRALVEARDGSIPDVILPDRADKISVADVKALLQATRNDLEPIAEKQVSAIEDLRRVMQDADGCLGARMSGSGATVFALFADPDQAQAAAVSCRQNHTWAVAAKVLS